MNNTRLVLLYVTLSFAMGFACAVVLAAWLGFAAALLGG